MFDFIISQILFYITIIFALFLPGYFLILAIFGKNKSLAPLEKFVVSFGISIVVVDFITFLYSKLNILITRWSEIIGIFIFCIVCFSIYKFGHKNSGLSAEKTNDEERTVRSNDLFSFSKNQFILILLLLFLAVFIKTVYLSGSIAPTTTDMGHHMYWSKLISQNGKLTDYADSVITSEDVGKFIVGEHVPFAVINLISGADFFSAFPATILYLINLLGILTVFILSLRVFKNKNIAILTLLFLGVLYAVSSPQAKYVSGGVIGNIFGNFLMPLSLYFYYRAFEFLELNGSSTSIMEVELPQAKKFLSCAVFVTFGLFYTHHLTGFIFLFVWLLLIPFFAIINYKEIKTVSEKIFKVVLSPYVIGTFILGLIFFFFIFTPSYVKTTAVETAVGAPSKATRVGLTLTNLKDSVGESRIALGFLGILLLFLNYKRKNVGYAIVAAWGIMVFIMSSYPHLLFVNLPSNRIGNYLTYPLAILSAYGLYVVFNPQYSQTSIEKISRFVPATLLKSAFLITLAFVFTTGISDSIQAFKKQDNSNSVMQTFHAAQYLAKNNNSQDVLLKDHNYITGDSWIKLFFLRNYTYPASRGFFSRYEDATKPREMCTLYMISNPGGEDAKKCFADSGTNFIMVNPRYDSAQFMRLPNFDQVYVSNEIGVYYRK